MASKAKTDIYTQFRQQYQKRLPDAQQKAKAIAEAYEQDGTPLSDAEIEDLTFQLAYGGEFDLQREAPTQATEPVLPTTEETAPEDMGFWESRVAGLQQDIGEIGAVVDAFQGGGQRDAAAILERFSNMPAPGNEAARAWAREVAPRLRAAADVNQRAAAGTLDPITAQGGIEGFIAQTSSDAASSGASSAASLIGGPFGAVAAGGITYANAYAEAKDAGASDAEAEAYALTQGTIEGAVSAIPAEKALEKIPFVGRYVKGTVRQAATGLAEKLTNPALAAAIRSAKTVGGEYVEEAGTNIAQDLTGAWVAGQMESDAGKELREQHTEGGLEGLLSRANRAGIAGAAMGVATTPRNIISAEREFEQQASEREQRISDAIIERSRTRPQQPAATTTTSTTPERQGELFPETTPGPTSAVPETPEPQPQPSDRAIDDPEVSAQRREVLRARRDREMARVQELEQQVEEDAMLEGTAAWGELQEQNVADLERSRGRVDLLNNEIAKWEGGAATQGTLPLNTPKQPKPTKPKPIQTRGGDTVIQPDGTTTSNVDAANRKEAEKILQDQAKEDKAAIDAEFKKRTEKHKANRVAHLKEIANANRDLPAEQRAGQIATAARQWDAANPAPTRDAITLADVAKPAPKAKKTATPAAPTPAVPTKPASKEEEKIKGLADKLGLAMAEDGSTPTPDRKQYETRVRQIVRSLSRSNTQKDIDILNMAEQGKLEFVPNPESAGHTQPDNVRALYRPSEGKMYIYTDRVDPKDAVATVIRGYHEGTHGGQFNEREGRSAVLRTLLGDQKYGNAVEIIKRAAASGNKVAKAAVDQAARQAPDAQDLEIPAYFVGEVVKNRSRPLGSVAGVARDIMAGAKNAVRTVVGGDPNVSFNDIFSAVNNLGQEIVATDLRPTQGADREMIMNERATGFDRAREEARDFVDEMGRIKFLMSDADSTLNEDGVAELRNLRDGETLPLSSILNHPELYANYPAAANIQVGPAPNLKSAGVYVPIFREIQIKPNALNAKSKTDLRGLLLHEIQHWIQDEGGESDMFHGGVMDARNLNERQLQIVDDYNRALANNDAQIDRVLNNVDVFRRELTSRTQQAGIDKILSRDDLRVKKAAALAQAAEDAGGLSPHLRRIVDDFVNSLTTYRDAADKYNEVSRAAFDRYTANPTEAEAFFTQAYRDVPDSRLPRNPRTDPRYGLRSMQEAAFGRGVGDLAMAEDVAPEITRRYAPSWVRGLFDATKGLGREANEIIEHAMESPAGDRMRAEGQMGKYDFAIDQLAQERGVTSKELNAEIEKAIDAIPNDLEGYEANRAAFDAVANKYGAAGEALKALRDQVDELSMTIVQQRADSGVPLNEQEKKTYQTIINNLGRYTHRQYVAHAGKLGHKYSKSVFKDYEKYRAGKGKDDPVVKENFSRVADAVKYIVENNLAIPANEELGSLGADQTRRLYTTWIGNPHGVSLEDQKTRLADNRDRVNGDTDALIKEAETITKELLDLAPSNSPITTYYRGGKLDTGILQRRTAIAPQIRKLMGEVTDPSMRMLMTVAKQAEFVAKQKMMLELIANPQGDILPPGSRIPDGWSRLTGDSYGPMQDYVVSPNMKDAVGDVVQILATFEQAVAMSARNPKELGQLALNKLADGWSIAASTSKIMQIVWSPMNFAYNLLGGPSIMLMNGNVNPSNLARGVRDAIGLVGYAIDPKSADADIIKLVENGVVDSAFIGEIKNEQYRDLRKLVREMAGRERNPTVQTLIDGMQTIRSGVKETYAMMDVLYKIANFHHQVDVLTEFYKANGDTRTEEQIMREAADNTKRTNFTYRRAMPIVKAIEQRGFSAFGPYMNEVFRTQITNILQGLGEIQRGNNANTPEAAAIMRRMGTKRILGQIISMGLWSGVSYILGNLTFGEDDDEAEAKRALLAEYLRDQDFVQVGTDENGYPVLFNVARFDPMGPATDFIRSVMHGQDPIESLSDKLVDVYITPRIGTQLGTAVKTTWPGSTHFPSREPLSQQLAPEAYSTLLDVGKEIGIPARITKAWTNVAETMLPGVTTSWRSTNARPERSDFTSSAFNVLSYSGANMSSLDPKKPIQFAAMDLKTSTELARKELAEFFKDNPNRSLESTMGQVLDGRSKERQAYDEARRVYEGAEAMGWNKSRINALLKKQRLNAAQVKSLANGRFDSQVVSKDSFDRFRDFELNDAPKSEQREIKKRWNEAWKMLNKASSEIKKEE